MPASARPAYDVVILGGGLAGLSLAVRLAEVPGCRTLVVEPRSEYRRDRTWSYWPVVDHPFREAVATRWATWEVMRRGPGGGAVRAVQTNPAQPYESIPADRLYAIAREAIERAPQVELWMGCSADALAEERNCVVVETSAGAVEAVLVFDSRPPPCPSDGLVQRFLGQEVRVDRPVFDPGRATLMDFAVPQQPGAVRFVYVLPGSATEALVEDTWLAPADAGLPDARAAIRTYVAERYGAKVEAVGFEEQGAIPMSPGLQAPTRIGRVIPIGTLGGAVKPSSGYGFLGAQRMAAHYAAAIATGARPRAFQPRGPAARWMDAVLLYALRRWPERAPEIFESLFARCRPEPLIRFLNDLGTPADAMRVVAAMPKLPMMTAAVAQSFGR